MRLWHQFLIPRLDRQRLLSQHRECCALRGKGWGKKHSVVDYVFKHDLAHLYEYHMLVMCEMGRRGYEVSNSLWYLRTYRGADLKLSDDSSVGAYMYPEHIDNYIHNGTSFDEYVKMSRVSGALIYPEHDIAYLKECLLNLKSKGARLEGGESIDEMLVKIDLKL